MTTPTDDPTVSERRQIVWTAAQCARQGLVHVPADEPRPLAAIEMAERWAQNDPTMTESLASAAATASAVYASVAYFAGDLAASWAAGAAAHAFDAATMQRGDCGHAACDCAVAAEIAEASACAAHAQEQSMTRADTPLVQVAGTYMDRSIADFQRACETHIDEEQRKTNPDTAIIALLCDAIRCSRELSAIATKATL